jgi:hypothetical protein
MVHLQVVDGAESLAHKVEGWFSSCQAVDSSVTICQMESPIVGAFAEVLMLATTIDILTCL